MIYRVEIEVVAPVMPTEDPDRVAAAVTNIFPSATVDHRDGEVIATAHALDRFSTLLAEQRIRETARSRLLEGIEGDVVAFTLKKQAAHAGVVNFGLEEPDELGDLAVRIRVDQPSPERLVEAITTPEGISSP